MDPAKRGGSFEVHNNRGLIHEPSVLLVHQEQYMLHLRGLRKRKRHVGTPLRRQAEGN